MVLQDTARRDTARLFIALWPSRRVRDALSAWQRAWAWPAGAVLVRSDDLHLTLHFLGNVKSTDVAALERALQRPMRGFEMRFGRAGVWRGGLAVAEPDEVPAGLIALHADLGDALRRLGLPVESRAFRPHVTLARHASAAGVAPAQLAVRWQARGFTLVESIPGHSGGYFQRRRFP